MSVQLAVQAENLVKTYPGDVLAVKGISFEVGAGEAFGLLGPNGAGKTTTIGMLNTTVTPTAGRAWLGGVDVAQDPMGTRAVSSVVFQDAVVDQPLTGRQNLELHMRLWGVDVEVGRDRFAELTRTVGIADIVDRAVSTYSGGQRRRMEIVRALLSAPEVLFLDEPTVGLDTRIRHDLFDIIATLREKTGVTIIMTTHYLDEAERLCDRLGVIDSGRLVACDSAANLLAMVGDEVLELRVEDADASSDVLRRGGVAPDDLLAIGGTLTVSLRGMSSGPVLDLLAHGSIPVHSVTTRPPSLDDVYLHLTGGRMTADAA
jgi:ABC-2 type transport system ATP-binding protein